MNFFIQTTAPENASGQLQKVNEMLLSMFHESLTNSNKTVERIGLIPPAHQRIFPLHYPGTQMSYELGKGESPTERHIFWI